LRSAETRAQHLAALEAKADRAKGGRTLAALIASEPDAALWFQIVKARTIAIERGEKPPEFLKLVPVEPPSFIKQLGRSARKKREKRERELVAQNTAGSQS
jgi:hypothetical protein